MYNNSIDLSDILESGIKTQEIQSDNEITFRIDDENVSFTLEELQRIKELLRETFPEDYI